MTDTSLVMRFWAKVDKRGKDECWPWTGANNKRGYGKIKLSGGRTTAVATRVSLALHQGINIPGSDVMCCHRCDNPICVNPNHLYWGDVKTNSQDAVNRGRLKGLDQSGDSNHNAKLTDRKVMVIKSMLNKGCTNTEIAELIDVSDSTISLIRLGKSWTHLNEAA